MGVAGAGSSCRVGVGSTGRVGVGSGERVGVAVAGLAAGVTVSAPRVGDVAGGPSETATSGVGLAGAGVGSSLPPPCVSKMPATTAAVTAAASTPPTNGIDH